MNTTISHRPSSRILTLILAAGIIIETQYIINSWVYSYGANKDVVNYVSFAGTIISIILAVLAIVYSYYQNFAQQRDSTTIATQITELRRLIEHADQSSSTLTGELAKLQEISSKLDTNIEIVKTSQQIIDQLSGKLDALKEAKIESGSATVSANLPAPDEIAKSLIGAAIPIQIVLYKMIQTAVDRTLEFDEMVEQFVKPCLKFPAIEDWVKGNLMSICYILLDLKLIGIDPGNQKLKLIRSVSSFKDQVNQKFTSFLENPKSIDAIFDALKLKAVLGS